MKDELSFFNSKQKKKHSVSINDNLAFILKDFIDINCDDIMNTTYTIKIDQEYQFTFNTLKNKYKEIQSETITSIISGDKTALNKIVVWRNALDDVRFKVYGKIMIELSKYARMNQDKFIVDLLKNQDFENIVFNANTILTKYQYNQISSKTAIYNKKLKELQKLCKINVVLTSHITRHTYTNLLIENTENDIYSISKSLGHQRLSTTEHYLSDFNNERTDRVNKDLNDLFFN